MISICGAGRNVGKTYLGESIISHFSAKNNIVAIKISKIKHKNHQTDCLKELYKTENYTIWEEMQITNKDSGRYLKSGAKLSIYIESNHAHLLEAFFFAKNNYCESSFIICESASIVKVIKPAVSIFVNVRHLPIPNNKLECYELSDVILNSFSTEISEPQLFLEIENNKWVVKTTKKEMEYGKV